MTSPWRCERLLIPWHQQQTKKGFHPSLAELNSAFTGDAYRRVEKDSHKGTPQHAGGLTKADTPPPPEGGSRPASRQLWQSPLCSHLPLLYPGEGIHECCGFLGFLTLASFHRGPPFSHSPGGHRYSRKSKGTLN